MDVHVFPTGAEVGEGVAMKIVDGIRQARLSGTDYLLGCPAGRSARSTYRSLSRRISAERIPVDHLCIVMMDAYVLGKGGSFHLPRADEHWSCQHFADQEIVAPINNAAPTGKGIAAHRVWIPDPNNPMEFDERIRSAGGIDLFLLASGSTDGHIGFNPPGSHRSSTTRVVRLAESTRRDNLKTYPRFTSVEDVPAYGVTVGISTIAENSHSAIMLTLGTEKRTTFERMTSSATDRADSYDPTWPASIVRECRRASIYADHDAAQA